MYINYHKISKNARIWIYQSNRQFTENEIEKIQKSIELFLQHWKRHNKDLVASYQIIYKQFLVVLVDESIVPISGCAIDESTDFIKNIEKEFGVDMTNKFLMSYKQNNEIKISEFTNFKEEIKKGIINEDTIVFNNLVTTKQELETLWEVPLKESWHKKLIK